MKLGRSGYMNNQVVVRIYTEMSTRKINNCKYGVTCKLLSLFLSHCCDVMVCMKCDQTLCFFVDKLTFSIHKSLVVIYERNVYSSVNIEVAKEAFCIKTTW